MKRKNPLGMTLLEVLLVVAILGVISALVVPRLVGRQKEANVDATRLSINGLEHALKLYAVDHYGDYPTTVQGLRALYEKPGNQKYWRGPYLETAAKDAWGNRFDYRYPGVLRPDSFDLISSGPDGELSTEDDISNQVDTELY